MPPLEIVAEVAHWVGLAAAFVVAMWSYSTLQRILEEVNAGLPHDEQIVPEIHVIRGPKLWWEAMRRHRRSHPTSRLRSRYWRQLIGGVALTLVLVLSKALQVQ